MMIKPALIDASTTVENALQTHKGRASTAIEGRGNVLHITYQSSEPLEIYMVPLSKDKNFILTDYIRFTLPKAENGSVAIDLTVSPGWSFKKQKWIMNILSIDEKTGAQFTSMQLTKASLPTTLKAAARHVMTMEPYTPSSYHALHGYRILGTSFTVMLAVLSVIIVLACLTFVPSTRRRTAVISVLTISMLLYQTRFSIDLLRYTHEHLIGFSHDIYDEAGSVSAIANDIRSFVENQKSFVGTIPSVFVCRDGTNFKEKLLRYFTYPVRVSAEPRYADTATLAVVMSKFKHGHQTTPTDHSAIVRLQCGPIDRLAEELNRFPDGAILFKLLPSSASKS